MSDYRYSLAEHNGINCLHVLIDGEDGEAHIPVVDILKSLQKHLPEKHDGKLDTLDQDSSTMYLDPQQALSLLAWLQLEVETLEKLVEEKDKL